MTWVLVLRIRSKGGPSLLCGWETTTANSDPSQSGLSVFRWLITEANKENQPQNIIQNFHSDKTTFLLFPFCPELPFSPDGKMSPLELLPGTTSINQSENQFTLL